MNIKEFLPLEVVQLPFKVEWKGKDTPRANKDRCLKSLARDMFERGCSFDDFEKECERLRNLQESDKEVPPILKPDVLCAVVPPSETS